MQQRPQPPTRCRGSCFLPSTLAYHAVSAYVAIVKEVCNRGIFRRPSRHASSVPQAQAQAQAQALGPGTTTTPLRPHLIETLTNFQPSNFPRTPASRLPPGPLCLHRLGSLHSVSTRRRHPSLPSLPAGASSPRTNIRLRPKSIAPTSTRPQTIEIPTT